MASSKKRNYIGLAVTLHDPALAIVNSAGEVVFAEATERYLQDKRAYNSIPDNLIRTPQLIKEYCEPGAELVVGISWSKRFWSQAKLVADTGNLLSTFKIDPLFTNQEATWPWITIQGTYTAMFSNMQQAANNLTAYHAIKNKVTVKYYDHHLTHAATACYTSPFTEGACAVVDGIGETRSCDFFSYRQGEIKSILPPWTGTSMGSPGLSSGSLGYFYGTLCGLCGFDAIKGEEWKVMGLAPYGQYNPQLYALIKPIICVDGLKVVYDFRRHTQWLTKMRGLMRKPGSSPLEAADLAYNGQLVFEETLIELLNNFYEKGLSQNLILAGGCALNSTCNGILTERTSFKRVFVPSAPGDDGNAIGAALLAYHEDHPATRPCTQTLTPYLGSRLSSEVLNNFITFSQHPKIQHLPGEVHKHAARLLAEGKIIGWLQGRAEFGPRALGNRSILADPRRADMKELINARVKFREEFRPFAPAILHEFGPDYFENYQETPYMERTLRFKAEVRDKVPAVVHANETGRLQTVKKEWSEKFYNLIEEFYHLTNIPIILNTSYNVMGKPIAHSVEDALSVFYTTGLDALVIEDYLIEK
jgi:carbamoyltransferase